MASRRDSGKPSSENKGKSMVYADIDEIRTVTRSPKLSIHRIASLSRGSEPSQRIGK